LELVDEAQTDFALVIYNNVLSRLAVAGPENATCVCNSNGSSGGSRAAPAAADLALTALHQLIAFLISLKDAERRQLIVFLQQPVTIDNASAAQQAAAATASPCGSNRRCHNLCLLMQAWRKELVLSQSASAAVLLKSEDGSAAPAGAAGPLQASIAAGTPAGSFPLLCQLALTFASRILTASQAASAAPGTGSCSDLSTNLAPAAAEAAAQRDGSPSSSAAAVAAVCVAPGQLDLASSLVTVPASLLLDWPAGDGGTCDERQQQELHSLRNLLRKGSCGPDTPAVNQLMCTAVRKKLQLVNNLISHLQQQQISNVAELDEGGGQWCFWVVAQSSR
jgi:hypothetical protein